VWPFPRVLFCLRAAVCRERPNRDVREDADRGAALFLEVPIVGDDGIAGDTLPLRERRSWRGRVRAFDVSRFVLDDLNIEVIREGDSVIHLFRHEKQDISLYLLGCLLG
jgi:hypothetical protein